MREEYLKHVIKLIYKANPLNVRDGLEREIIDIEDNRDPEELGTLAEACLDAGLLDHAYEILEVQTSLGKPVVQRTPRYEDLSSFKRRLADDLITSAFQKDRLLPRLRDLGQMLREVETSGGCIPDDSEFETYAQDRVFYERRLEMAENLLSERKADYFVWKKLASAHMGFALEELKKGYLDDSVRHAEHALEIYSDLHSAEKKRAGKHYGETLMQYGTACYQDALYAIRHGEPEKAEELFNQAMKVFGLAKRKDLVALLPEQYERQKYVLELIHQE
jgi:hypothetical protein